MTKTCKSDSPAIAKRPTHTIESQGVIQLVSAAPAFPLPSATLAKRVSDRERKGRGEQPEA